MEFICDAQDEWTIAVFNAFWENKPMSFHLELTPFIKGEVQI